MLKPLSSIFLLTLLMACQSESNESTQLPEQETKQPAVIRDDSIYQSAATFTTRQFSLPFQMILKYKPAAEITTISPHREFHRPGIKEAFYSLVTDNGTKYKLNLANNTNVCMNSGSVLLFHPDNGTYCEFKGEGYFEIGEQTAVIKLGYKTQITARPGTRIHIQYCGDSAKRQHLTATLLKGKATINAGKQTATLNKPGMQKLLTPSRQQMAGKSCDTADVLSWTRNDFNYKHIDSYSLLQRIADWYGKKLVFPQNLPVEYNRFTGDYKEPLASIINKVNHQYTGITSVVQEDSIIVLPMKRKAI